MSQDIVDPGVPAAEAVTLANWRSAPYSRWGFRNVEQRIACAQVAPSAQPLALPRGAPLDLAALSFEHAGRRWRADEALADSDTDAFLVLQDGAVRAEAYFHGQSADSRHIVFSVSKSITGALAGALVAEGALDPEAPVSAYLELPPTSAYAECSVRHVLDMTVDIRFIEDYLDPLGDVARYRVAMGWNPSGAIAGEQDLHGFVAGLPRAGGRHGERFHYVSPNSDLLGRLLEAASGQSIPHLLETRLWQPLGAADSAWITVDARGASRTAGGFCCTLRDLARFAELIRQHGRAAGRQVLPAAWIEDILGGGDPQAWQRGEMTELFPRARYRAQWYLPESDPGVCCAIGIHGQWIWIDARANLVLVKQSSQAIPADDALDHLNLALFRALSERLRP